MCSPAECLALLKRSLRTRSLAAYFAAAYPCITTFLPISLARGYTLINAATSDGAGLCEDRRARDAQKILSVPYANVWRSALLVECQWRRLCRTVESTQGDTQ